VEAHCKPMWGRPERYSICYGIKVKPVGMLGGYSVNDS
jgi:hypothetical protein